MSSERSYLDGVPLRLSAKFFPIPRVQYKEIDIHIPIDALQEDYDFTLERSVIVEARAWEEEQQRLRAERESQERLEREKAEIARLAESIKIAETGTVSGDLNTEDISEISSEQEEDSNIFEASSEATSETQGATAATISVPPSTVSNSHSNESVPQEEDVGVTTSGQPVIFSNFGSNSATPVPHEYIQTYRQDIAGAVLQPQPQPLPGDYDSKSFGNDRVASKDSDHSYHQSVIPTSKINLNLSDFESDTANPFDNVELKSINDMEVLASVLKNNSVTAATPVPQNQGPSRTVNMNYMNGVTSMGYNSEQTPLMYFPSSSYPNQNFPSTWAPNQYYNPIPPSISSSPAEVTQSLASNLETPTITQPQISSQSNLPPNSINSFTRFYFPLLTSMANSRANRDRNVSSYSGLPSSSGVYGNPIGQLGAMGPPASGVPPLVNQNPISTPAPTMYLNNSVQHRHVASHSPSQLYWTEANQQTGTHAYVPSNRLGPPYPSEPTLSSVNPTLSFQNASSLSTSPKGTHPTLH